MSKGSSERGQALIITLIILGMAGAALVYQYTASSVSSRERDRRTAAALAQARAALLGRAAADDTRPGSLPCPDVNNDGSADGPFPTDCTSYIGRLPWRTLGLPDLRDGAGERLWYALSSNFRDHPTAGPLNSDSVGQLTVQNGSGAVLDNRVIAIVLAPGAVLGTQARSGANQLSVGMYLDGDNADGDATYTLSPPSDVFNDRLVYITAEALFSGVTARVAKEARAALEHYRSNNGYYPNANPYTAGAPTYYCDPNTLQGRIATTINTATPPAGCTAQANWAGELPSWFATNNWNLVTYYAVASVCTQSDPASEQQCDLNAGAQPLVVTGISASVRMLVAVTGPARPGENRPCASSADCLEDAANTDGNSVYVKPSRMPASNDHMALTCGNAAPCAVVP